MNRHVDKSKNDKAVVKNNSAEKDTPTFQFVDQRPEALAQRKIQEIADQSPQVRRASQLQTAANQKSLDYQNHHPKTSESAQPIQAKIKSFFEGKLTNDEIDSIQGQVDKYNIMAASGDSFPERKAALQQLFLVERMIHQWFSNQQNLDLDADPMARNMKFLMNSTQEERMALVGKSLESKDEEPPVAGLDHLPPLVQAKVKMLWAHLLAGKGIAIKGGGAFTVKILSDFSRLLELEMGRRLISGIIQTGKGLVITPTTLAEGKFVAQPIDYEKESMYRVDPKKVDTSGFVSLDLRGRNQAQRLDVLQDLRVHNPKSTGVQIISEKGAEYYAFSEGSGSELPVPVDAQDAMPHSSSRMSDSTGNEIIAPTFINLGHELGHVLRSAQGMSASAEGGKLIAHGFPDVSQSDRPEEFFNIGGVENSLRLEAGIPARHDHGNLYSQWAVNTMNGIEKLEAKIKKIVPEITKPQHREAIKKIQTDIEKLRTLVLELMGGKGSIKAVINHLIALRKRVVDIEMDL